MSGKRTEYVLHDVVGAVIDIPSLEELYRVRDEAALRHAEQVIQRLKPRLALGGIERLLPPVLLVQSRRRHLLPPLPSHRHLVHV